MSEADLIARMEAARDFPAHTCSASRHAQEVAADMLRGRGATIDVGEHVGESIAATVTALWEARSTIARLAAERDKARADVASLRNEVHNLNWALGTPGYEQMATPEEQAEAEAATTRVNDLIARMAANKAAHEATEKDAERYRWLRDAHPATEEVVAMRWKTIEALRHEELDAAIDDAIRAAMKAQQ